MALRLSRMYTGKSKILKFCGHFHGWHDAVSIASDPPYDSFSVPGVPEGVAQNTIAIPPNNIDLLEATLKSDDQIAAVILEPTGGHWGAVPIRGAFLKALRELTTRYGVLLIFDEVITGFRVSPGGAEVLRGDPRSNDAGENPGRGTSGGCLVGRAEILNQIENRPGKPHASPGNV